MTSKQTETYHTSWADIPITVRYTRAYFGAGTEFEVDHLEIRSDDRVKLPITETGYRSHWITDRKTQIEDFGGNIPALVCAWLDEEAQSPAWQRHLQDSRQLSLF